MLSEQIVEAVKAIKSAILKAQTSAARDVNRAQLTLYYGIGKYVSENSREGTWGTGAIDAISDQLQKELPGLRGFSGRNLRNMRKFYEFLSPFLFWQMPSAKLPGDSLFPLEPVWQMPSAKLDAEQFFSVGFSHHLAILEQTTEYAVRDYNKPMGVAVYRTADEMPERLRKALPPVEEMRKKLTEC